MKALNNLKKLIPEYFEKYVDTNIVDVVQIFQFPEFISVLLFDKNQDKYFIADVYQPWQKNQSEKDLFSITEYITIEEYLNDAQTPSFEHASIENFEMYASYRFAISFGIPGL